MKDPNLRTFMGWVFAAQAALDVVYVVASSVLLYSRHHTILSQRNMLYLVSHLAPAVICGVASWVIREKKRFARVWGVVASLTFLVTLLRFHYFPRGSSWAWNIPTIFITVTGVLVFLLPEKQVAEDPLEPVSEI
ncbi:MAG TPA: hypothetical protein VG273_10960 [Bryobacteraceae bacterium]|jgi:hypothetical protein|nr:hypothetical protein [Bryobacteraceae bacterium]